MRLTERIVGTATACSLALLVSVSTAHADDRIGDGNLDPPPGEKTDAGHESGEINAQARITFTVTRGGGGTGALKSSTPWEPPACYYAPTHTPEEMARHWRDFYANTNRDIWPDEMRESIDASHEEQYGEEGKYPEYNREMQGEGMF
ncbi:hypothetical protein [Streptomyces lonarensis]|uniref:Uncharacterized protein n=1 Tax=Streptomyces lonarensis TaxID=700599 RepID=A0A7X6D079_9ACTN|nr:hypothetical protein [Streptomyces lonarensis]NJQ05793.1 hypothetical protein [Streptomyces lonarensis]